MLRPWPRQRGSVRGRRQTRHDLKQSPLKRPSISQIRAARAPDAIQNADAGITRDDIALAVQDEYAEGAILPPADSAEEWLKLLDHHPDQVVSVSPFGKSGVERELPIRTII